MKLIHCEICNEWTIKSPCGVCAMTAEDIADHVFFEFFRKSKRRDVDEVCEILKKLCDENE
jgi:hypothetical protein